jgi:hypothetical protein
MELMTRMKSLLMLPSFRAFVTLRLAFTPLNLPLAPLPKWRLWRPLHQDSVTLIVPWPTAQTLQPLQTLYI